ncbi:hypothetical protein MWU78_20905 [Arenibacter sp. F26102]|uniref:ornithine cyclodeaminase family protein n=1 Tax=Arenibacter sp. F26102 TaxID=2926416 RepID=UPI001FF14651|nr:hypothetical protein [Arenibacter sp. F26102]MCK0148119.1 hypothetical protein [Arenibacter sp. F26102]
MYNKENSTLILTGSDVCTIVEKFGLDNIMDVLVRRLQLAIESYDPKCIDIPIRSGFNYNTTYPGLIEWMPLHQQEKEIVIKVVGYHPKNPENFKLPSILSSISSYDTRTGHLKGVADGVLLTALRTGAASAVASRKMAIPESTTLGLIGCGAQSITQLHALSRVFNFKKAMIYDIDDTAMESFKRRINMLNLNLEVASSSISNIVQEVDILCTETAIEVGKGPLFSYQENHKKHLHINAIGSDFPGKIELPVALLNKSFVCPDFLEQAKIEGECQQLKPEEIGPSLVHLIQNKTSYDYVKTELSVFDSTGWALEDQVVLELFLDLAKEFNIGLNVHLEHISSDVKNPYHFLLSSVEV